MTFLSFASVEYDGNVYMTPDDFLQSVIDDKPRCMFCQFHVFNYIYLFIYLNVYLFIQYAKAAHKTYAEYTYSSRSKNTVNA